MKYEPIAKTGDRILEALRDAGMKQADLARLAGLNTGSLSCWISGRYEPKQTALHRMGKVLGVTEMWLAGYDVPKERTAEQKQADLLSDVTERARKDQAFMELLQKACTLTPEQIFLLSQLVDQITGTTENK